MSEKTAPHVAGIEISDEEFAKERDRVYRTGTAGDIAEQAWKDLTEVAASPLSTNDPYIAVALHAIVAELRVARSDRYVREGECI